jgi:DNA-damage-inducible protein D
VSDRYFDLTNPTFEDSFHTNGNIFWYASEFVIWLGYNKYSPTMQPISKALSVCLSLPSIVALDHFKEEVRLIDGKETKDFKLSRFACYLVAMNSDIKKEAVAKAQAYFAAFTIQVQEFIRNQNDIERIPIRKELSEHEKALFTTAKFAGVEQYAFFNNKGYMGLYNMSIRELRDRKGIPQTDTPLDYMGAEELGANIFRITQTDAKIKREGLTGQQDLESAAYQVGKTVREAIRKTGGTMPEDLPSEVHINKVKSELGKPSKVFGKEDKKKIGKTVKIKPFHVN